VDPTIGVQDVLTTLQSTQHCSKTWLTSLPQSLRT
jgi:hypothetical protein